jgi:signal recognition particle subunit SRP72
LPKGFDPENPGPLDPERWLPKWQRSDFRKKKRGQHQRAQQQNVKGSQGAGKVDENLDRSSVPLAEAAAPATTSAQPPKGGKKGKKGKR